MASEDRSPIVVTRLTELLGGRDGASRPGVQTFVRYTPLYAFIILWELAGLARALPYYVPAPHSIAAQMWTTIQTGALIEHSLASLTLIYAGFVCAAIAGIGMGVLTGRSKRIGLVFDPFVSSIYPIPKIALFPLFLVWLGLGFNSKLVVLAIAVFFPIYVNTNDGVRTIDRYHLWSAWNFDASRLQVLKDVILPSALPHIFSGLRVSMALAFIVVFSTEMIAASKGLGHLVMMAQRGQNFPLMYTAIVTIAVLGFFHTRAIVKVQDQVLYWTDAEEGL